MARIKRVPQLPVNVAWNMLKVCIQIVYFYENDRSKIGTKPYHAHLLDLLDKFSKKGSQMFDKQFFQRELSTCSGPLAKVLKKHFKKPFNNNTLKTILNYLIKNEFSYMIRFDLVQMAETKGCDLADLFFPVPRKGEKINNQIPRTALEAAKLLLQRIYHLSPKSQDKASKSKIKWLTEELNRNDERLLIELLLERIWEVDSKYTKQLAKQILKVCNTKPSDLPNF